MKTIEEEIKLLKTAHQRLFNQYQELNKNYDDLKERFIILNNYIQEVDKENYEFRIKLIKSTPKESFKDGKNYSDIVDEIISSEIVQWNSKQFINMELKLVDRNELFKAFVPKGNEPKVGNKVKFTYIITDNKLSKLKVL
jgi:predicted nuclease with TOPRIM domain